MAKCESPLPPRRLTSLIISASTFALSVYRLTFLTILMANRQSCRLPLRCWHSMTRPKVPMPTSRRSRNRWSTMVPGPPRKCPTVSSRDEVEELRWLGSSALTLLRRGDLAAASVELRRRRSFRPWRDRRLPRRRRLGVSEWFRRRS